MSRRFYREFYLLPRGEQRALIVLSLLLIISLLFRITVRLLPEREPEPLEEFVQEAQWIMASMVRADSLHKARADSLRSAQADSLRQARAGGAREGAGGWSASLHPMGIPVDINRADSVRLLPLPGIGPVFAGRLIRYRDLLGGYISVSQLSEVYGLPQETVETISALLIVDTLAVKKLDLNRATFRELLRHPYLEYEDVKSLVNFRDFRDTIRSYRELQSNQVLPDSLLRRIRPYLGI